MRTSKDGWSVFLLCISLIVSSCSVNGVYGTPSSTLGSVPAATNKAANPSPTSSPILIHLLEFHRDMSKPNNYVLTVVWRNKGTKGTRVSPVFVGEDRELGQIEEGLVNPSGYYSDVDALVTANSGAPVRVGTRFIEVYFRDTDAPGLPRVPMSVADGVSSRIPVQLP